MYHLSVDGDYCMNNKKICIITGCAGFIGSHLTETCLNMGWYVYGIDKLSYCSFPELMTYFLEKYPNNFKFVHSDINNIKHLPEVDILFNICAESHVDNSIENSDEFIKSNVNGVHNLLEIIRHKKIRPLFYQMSTDEIYGDKSNGSHTEEDNYNPSNPYSFSKASADLLVKSYNRTYGIQYKIGRATNTYGTRQNSEKLIPKTCKNLLIGKKIPLHNLGLPKRTWLNVNDCVNGILTIVEKGELNSVYNIGGNCEIENWRIVSKIANLLNINPPHENEFFYIPESPYPPLMEPIPGEIKPSEKGYYVWVNFPTPLTNMHNICEFSYHRDGQDVRYSLNDSKLRATGWTNKCDIDKELPSVVAYYRDKFVW